MRPAYRPSGVGGQVDDRVLPLINVVFLLLIFFMMVGELSATDPFSVEPPVSADSHSDDPGDVVLLIAADGRLALDGVVVPASGLRDALAERLKTAGGREVHVKADGDAPANAVVGILETLQGAGVERVQLMTVSDGG